MKKKGNVKEKFLELLFENKMIVIGSVIFLIAPGIWTVFFFNRAEFWNMDIIKLLVISVSMCAPVFAYCYMTLIGCRVQWKIDMDEIIMVGCSSMYTAFVFFIIILLKINRPDVKVENAMCIIVGLLAVFTIGNIIGCLSVNGPKKNITNE